MAARVGLLWALAFVTLESVQFVFFGGAFQRMNSYLFGAVVLGVSITGFLTWATVFRRHELRRAFRRPGLLLAINAAATLSWLSFLGSVQLIEPAVAYTIGTGVMPLAAWLFWRLGLPEGAPPRNPVEFLGMAVISVSVLMLAFVTLAGLSGFTRGGWAAAGVLLAVADGVSFTMLLILCQRLSRQGVGAATVFGLRFPLYVLVSAGLFASGAGIASQVDFSEGVWIVVVGLMLIVPPLCALQRAVDLVSTLTLATVTATGPFVIFLLQIVEGRVDHSGPTLAGLSIYFCGAIVAAVGAVRAEPARP